MPPQRALTPAVGSLACAVDDQATGFRRTAASLAALTRTPRRLRGSRRGRSARLFRRDPAVDLLLENRQRKRAGVEHLRMIFSDVELRPKRRLRLVAKLGDLQLADLVGQRLTRNGDVAFNLGRGVGLRFPRMVEHVL